MGNDTSSSFNSYEYDRIKDRDGESAADRYRRDCENKDWEAQKQKEWEEQKEYEAKHFDGYRWHDEEIN